MGSITSFIQMISLSASLISDPFYSFEIDMLPQKTVFQDYFHWLVKEWGFSVEFVAGFCVGFDDFAAS